MKIFEIVYYLVLGFIVLITLLLIASTFPIPGNYQVLMVQSGSMEPAIKMGGVVIVKPAEEYGIGDVVTFGPISSRSQPITHRIHDVKVVEGEMRYITKGDANDTPDQREISREDIIGKVLFSVPYVGYAVNFAKKPVGFALLIIVPGLIIIFDEAKKVYAEIKKAKTQ